MYGFIGSGDYFKEIKEFVIHQEETISYKIIGEDIDINETIESVIEIKVNHLIIDVAALEDEIALVQALTEFKKVHPKVQVILIIPLKYIPGNIVISKLIQIGIYDFIRHEIEQGNIEDFLYDLILHPTPRRKVRDWEETQYEDTTDHIEEYIEDEEDLMEHEEIEEHIEDEEYNERLHRGISLPKINLPKLPKKEPIRERTVTIIQEKIIGSVVIAISGVQSRIGVTHTAITLGNVLKEQGYKVALVELHKSNDFNIIKGSYKDAVDISSKNNLVSFNLNGMDYFSYSPELEILDVLEQDYNYIVLDMGTYNKCDITEFKRANVKLLVGGVKDWELQKLTTILKLNDNLHKNKYLFNFASNKRFEETKKDMLELPCYQLPINPEPYEIEDNIRDKFTEILKDVLPEKNTSKKHSSPLSIFKKVVKK